MKKFLQINRKYYGQSCFFLYLFFMVSFIKCYRIFNLCKFWTSIKKIERSFWRTWRLKIFNQFHYFYKCEFLKRLILYFSFSLILLYTVICFKNKQKYWLTPTKIFSFPIPVGGEGNGVAYFPFSKGDGFFFTRFFFTVFFIFYRCLFYFFSDVWKKR